MLRGQFNTKCKWLAQFRYGIADMQKFSYGVGFFFIGAACILHAMRIMHQPRG